MGTWIKATMIAIACGALCAEKTRADYFPPAVVEAAEEISFQSLLTDMALPSISTDPHNFPANLSYQGSFSQGTPAIQDGWDGTFSGAYLGSSVTGSMSALTIGDPNWQLSGQMTANGKTFNLSGTLVQDPKDPTKFYLQNGKWGPFSWSTPDDLTEKFKGDDDILTGKIKANENGQNITYDATITVALEFKNGKWGGKLTSSFKQIDPKGKDWADTGTAYFKNIGEKTSFLGAMNDQVATVPEPATATLFGAGILTLIGYTWRRRKGVAEVQSYGVSAC